MQIWLWTTALKVATKEQEKDFLPQMTFLLEFKEAEFEQGSC